MQILASGILIVLIVQNFGPLWMQVALPAFLSSVIIYSDMYWFFWAFLFLTGTVLACSFYIQHVYDTSHLTRPHSMGGLIAFICGTILLLGGVTSEPLAIISPVMVAFLMLFLSGLVDILISRGIICQYIGLSRIMIGLMLGVATLIPDNIRILFFTFASAIIVQIILSYSVRRLWRSGSTLT